MKFNIKILFISLIAVFILMIKITVAQSNNWVIEWDTPKAFIENKGQFSASDSNIKILYAYDNPGRMVYFTKNGVIFTFIKRKPDKNALETEEEILEKRQRRFSTPRGWLEYEAKKRKMLWQTDEIRMSFGGSSSNAELVASDKTLDYHNYEDVPNHEGSLNFVSGYKKLTYKNVYPNIDIIFTFHPEDGLKYDIDIKEGGDIEDIAIKYSKQGEIDDEGNFVMDTKFGFFKDHAPVSYLKETGETIETHFKYQNEFLYFSIPKEYLNKSIIVDPWILMPNIPNSNGVWECERDDLGNVYTIGGDMPMKLQKYSPTGTLLWTYNTPYDTANYWLGTFATDLSGNSYVTSGSSASIRRINSSGVLEWTNSPGIGNSNEYWNIAFNCDQTKLVIGGTTGSGFGIPPVLQGAIFDISTTDGSELNFVTVGWGNTMGFPPKINEVRSITSSFNARYYFLTLDTIGSIEQNFGTICPSNSPVMFRRNSTYNLSYKCENYRPSNGNAGVMAIRANRYFVYTQNGITVDKRSLFDGSILTSQVIPGGLSTTTMGLNQIGNSGIDIDSCGFVYIGSGDRIIKYDSDLNEISSIMTPFKIFDVAVSTNGNVVYCGATGTSSSSSRTGYIASSELSDCLPMSLYCCNTNICPAGPFCNNVPSVQLISEVTGGVWSGPGITNSSDGLFSPIGAGIGTHTIVYTLPCGSDSIQIQVNDCISLLACLETDGSVSVSAGNAPYSWQKQITSENCDACMFGCTVPPGCAVTTTTWTYMGTGTNLTPTSYPVRIYDSNGNMINIPNQESLPPCVYCPDINIYIDSINNPSCYMDSTGSFTLSADSGAAPYNFMIINEFNDTVSHLNNVNGHPSSYEISGLPSGTYTIIIQDANYCNKDTLIQITQPDSIAIEQVLIEHSTCGEDNGKITINVIGGTPPYSYSWNYQNTLPQNMQYTIENIPEGTYNVTVTDANNCSNTASFEIDGTPGIEANIEMSPEICHRNDGSAWIEFESQGDYQVIWSNGSTSDTISDLIQGDYTVEISDSLCTLQTTITVTHIDGPEAWFTYTPSVIRSPQETVYFYDESTGNIVQWEWNFGDDEFGYNSQPSHMYPDIGEYTVVLIVTDENGCIDSAQRIIKIIEPFELFIPNTIIVNNDGKNDVFTPKGISVNPNKFQMYIFDRWGGLMYYTNIWHGTQAEPWNGTIHNSGSFKDAIPGIYVYRILCSDMEDNSYEYVGHIHLFK